MLLGFEDERQFSVGLRGSVQLKFTFATIKPGICYCMKRCQHDDRSSVLASASWLFQGASFAASPCLFSSLQSLWFDYRLAERLLPL
ncbi:hypothetical protein AWV77_25370 [Pseudomonas palleroniana]|uniref:Uncharacterized protein n=1 Tax=Pseudomonas palleroniana TaxID=191390 RepID=A0A109FP84_9PSED|nr:hypothetical protein AWV77_25370 [Pseudomonas palleroniana]